MASARIRARPPCCPARRRLGCPLTEAERLNVQLMKRNAELERKLHVANVLIALQKKAHEVLGIALPESEEET